MPAPLTVDRTKDFHAHDLDMLPNHAQDILNRKIARIAQADKDMLPRSFLEWLVYPFRWLGDFTYTLMRFSRTNRWEWPANPLKYYAIVAAHEAHQKIKLGHYASIIAEVGESVYYRQDLFGVIHDKAAEELKARRAMGLNH